MDITYRLLLAGVAWGVGARYLLEPGFGLSVPLAAALLIGAGRLTGLRPAPDVRGRLAAGITVAFAATLVFAFRESWLARATAVGAAGAALAWGLARHPLSSMAHLAGARHAAGRLATGALTVLAERPPLAGVQAPLGVRRVGRGALMATPIALIFLILFAAADPVLAEDIRRLTDFDLGSTLDTALISSLLGWLGVGLFAAVWRPRPAHDPVVRRPGHVETLTIATVLVALFATGVAFQMRYLFGGDAYLWDVAGLTRAQYARRGFFELVTIALLAMPTIAWLRRPGATGRSEPALTGLLLALVAMLGLLLVSAGHRLLRYHEAYGMSEPRFYGGLVEVWLAGALAWLALLVAKGRTDWFLPPVAGWGVTLVLASAAVNPAAQIQRANIARAVAGGPFDAAHAVQDLGADGRPALMAGLQTLPPAARCATAEALRDHSGMPARHGLAWTLATRRARRAMHDRVPLNEALAGCAARADGSGGR